MLISLVFKEALKLWEKFQTEGKGKYGPPPSHLYITQTNKADWSKGLCLGEPQQIWELDRKTRTFHNKAAQQSKVQQVASGMFYPVVNIRFCISKDKQKLLLTFFAGPRYARGIIYEVKGIQPKLYLQNMGPLWVS